MTVGHATLDSYCSSLRVQRNHLVHLFKRKELMRAVGDLIEAVAGAKDLQTTLFFDKFLHLFQRYG